MHHLKYIALSLIFLFPIILNAQEPQRANSSDIYFKLKRLNNLGNVLYVAAHPDDENTHLLTYLIHEENITTTYYSLTRGEGGQNTLGKELGKPLGIIRTMEMLEARKIDGAFQKFGTAADFGFSKGPEETLKLWNKQKLVDETIEIIQELKPDIIICRFPITGEGGHGHHTSSAIVALEAFNQITNFNNKVKNKNKQLWQPKRIVFNAFSFGRMSTLRDDQFKMPLNQYNPLLGKSYAQIAGESRSVHYSQGAGTPQRYGITQEHFELMAGQDFKESLWENIDISWSKINAQHVENAVQSIIDNYNFLNPSQHLTALQQVYQLINSLEDNPWKKQKLHLVEEIIIDILGIRIELNTKEMVYTNEQLNRFELKVIQSTKEKINIKSVKFQDEELLISSSISVNKEAQKVTDFSIDLSSSATSTPNWLSEKTNSHFPIMIDITFEINNGIEIKKSYPLSHYYLDPIWGDKYQYTYIKPQGQIEIAADFLMKEKDGTLNIPLWLQIEDQTNVAYLELLKDGKLIRRQAIDWNGKNTTQFYQWSLKFKENEQFVEGKYQIHLKWYDTDRNTKTVKGVQKLIQYDHIPFVPYFEESTIKIFNNDFNSNIKQVGYIEGVGDKIGDILEQIGLSVDYIDPQQITNHQDLVKYDVIVIGIRAYNRIETLIKVQDILKEYVAKGGHIVVQYNTNHELLTEEVGFKPLTISRDRVTEEDAKVRFLLPQHPVLNNPHSITQDDFKDWTQERGLYFPNEWDNAYQAILGMNDTGEEEKQGALLCLKYGEGTYTYTGLSFFRQLPIGHKGAIKLFLNILEYNNP